MATITATDPTSLISSTTSFNVVSAVLQSLSLTVPSASLPKGETEQLTATGVLSDGSTEDLTNEVYVGWLERRGGVGVLLRARDRADDRGRRRSPPPIRPR